ncbi:MAG: hypothetical protein NTX86_05250 [Candidatus Dependentiae bacterium]|nr:hypothetical protein [Candidatus Dependentiae bacterium]
MKFRNIVFLFILAQACTMIINAAQTPEAPTATDNPEIEQSSKISTFPLTEQELADLNKQLLKKPTPVKIIKKNEEETKNNTEKNITRNPHLHDVIILLNTTENNAEEAISIGFTLALCEKQYPVITTSHIFNLFLTATEETIKKIKNKFLQECATDWTIYKTNDKSFYLFIPKTYDSQKDREDLGFNLKNLEEFTPSDQAIDVRKTIDLTSLQSMFTYKTAYKNMEDAGMWNIYLIGHGMYSKTLETAINKGLLPNQINTLSPEGHSDSTIAGLGLSRFGILLRFFIQAINTNFLHYISCYAGGYNTLLANMATIVNNQGVTLSNTTPDFFISMGSIGEDLVTFHTKKLLNNCLSCKTPQCLADAAKTEKSVYLAGFFDALHKYSHKDGTQKARFNDQQLKEILRPITDVPSIMIGKNKALAIAGLPQVMFPGTTVFRAVAINDDIKVITHVLARQNTLDKTPILIKSTEKTVLIYPTTISHIKMDAYSPNAFISATPTVNLHKITLLETASSFDLLLQAMRNVQYTFPKYFYIKTLEDSSKKTKRQVLIKVHRNQLDVVYTDESNTIQHRSLFYHNDTIKAVGKLNNLVSNNTFLNALANYFINPSLKKDFSYDILLSKLLTDDETKTIADAIKKFMATSVKKIKKK